MTEEQIAELQRVVLRQLSNAGHVLRDAGPPMNAAAEQLLAQVAACTGELERGVDGLDLLRSVGEFEHADGYEALWGLHQAFQEVEKSPGSAVPWAEDSPLEGLRHYSRRMFLFEQTRRLLETARRQLERGPIDHYVVARIKTHLERFETATLIRNVRLARIRGAHPEAAVQQVVDRLVFSEGLYPITHAKAGDGQIDVFVEEARPLFAHVAATHERPLLIELKQAMGAGRKAPTTRAEVLDAIRNGKFQAAEYRSHLVANSRWEAHQVVVIVVYDGPSRFQINDPEVLLAYVGPLTPASSGTLLTL